MYAGFWRRFAAALLDLMIVIVPVILLGIVVALVTGPRSTATLVADLCALAAFWLYFAIMESSGRQATLGKLAFGMRVTGLRGERISFTQATSRFFAKIFSALSLGVGFLIVAVTRRKQALHDMISSSLVVDAGAAPSDLRKGGYAQPMSGGAIVALVIGALSIPLAAAGTIAAIPHYQDYRVRTQIEDAMASARSLTSHVAAYMRLHKSLPPTLYEADALGSSPHVSAAAIRGDGTVVLTLAIDRLEGKRIAFVPSRANAGNIVWKCVSDEVASRYLPAQCRR